MSSIVHVDNKKKYISVLGEGPTKVLDDTTLTAGKMYSTNFTATKIGLNGSVFDFSVDYGAIAVDNKLDIHKYLIKKNGII